MRKIHLFKLLHIHQLFILNGDLYIHQINKHIDNNPFRLNMLKLIGALANENYSQEGPT
jgi:hypothetical protein